MIEKVDVAGVLAYKTKLDDMEFRCSNSVAALAVLIGSGACALLAPAARAGDPIDFSAPAIPLGVPPEELEVKSSTRMIGPAGVADGFMAEVEMAAPTQYYIVKPKTREREAWEKDVWGLTPLLGDDPDQREAGDLFSSRPDSTRATNSNRLNMKHGLNPNASGNPNQQRYGSGLEGGQDDSLFSTQIGLDGDDARFGDKNGFDRDKSRFGDKNGSDKDRSRFGDKNGFDRDKSRFGDNNVLDRDKPAFGAKNGLDKDFSKFNAKNGWDKDFARSSDRFGRGFGNADDEPRWTKAFSRDASGMERFNPMRLLPPASETRPFSGGVFEDRLFNPGLGQGSAQTAAPPSYPGFTSPDYGQSRPTDQPAGEGPISLRAWEPSASPMAPARSSSSPAQIDASRVVAPNRSASLPWPQRPNDPH